MLLWYMNKSCREALWYLSTVYVLLYSCCLSEVDSKFNAFSRQVKGQGNIDLSSGLNFT